MNDTITFARGADGLHLAKRLVLCDDTIAAVEPSPQCRIYVFREVEVSDLTSLMRAIWRASQRGDIAIRGRPKASTGRRAIHDDEEHGPAGLTIVPRRWVGFDWDNIPLAEAVAPELADDPAELPSPLYDPEIATRLALQRLPPAFREVSCGWQISASAGFKPGFRLRTWHWLDHPTTGLELKAWCRPSIKRHLVDPVTLVEAQPHYLAVTVAGGPDPCPQRFGILRQIRDEVQVPDLATIIRDHEAKERALAIFAHGHPPDPKYTPEKARSWAEKRIAECVENVRKAPDGTKHPTYVEEVARAKAICDRFGLDWQSVRGEIRAVYETSLPASEITRRRHSSTDGVLRWIEARP